MPRVISTWVALLAPAVKHGSLSHDVITGSVWRQQLSLGRAAAFYGAQGSTCLAMAFSIHVLAEKCKLSWGTHRFLEDKEPQSKPCFSDKSLQEVLRHHWLTRLLASDAQGMTLPTREVISFKFCEFIKRVKDIQIVGSFNISCDSYVFQK